MAWTTKLALIILFLISEGPFIMAEDLIIGVNSKLTDELTALGTNGVFFWIPDGSPDEAAMESFRQRVKEYREKGAKYFCINSVAPLSAEFFHEHLDAGVTRKRLKHAYSLNGPIAETFLQRVKTAAGWKLPVIYNLVPDEIYYANAHIPYTFGVPLHPKETYFCSSKEELAAFTKETGLNPPELTRSRRLKKNSREARQFILFRYRTLARTLKLWQRVARETFPEIETYSMLNLCGVYGLERYPSGLALDMLGPDAGFDYISATSFQCSYDWRGQDTHYYIPETVKHLIAGLPNARVYAFNSVFSWLPDSRRASGLLPAEKFAPVRPLDYYGTTISSVAHGADGFMSLRGGNPEECKPEVWIAQKQTIGTLAAVKEWIEGADTPKDIALLFSRASEDFYALANEDSSIDAWEDGSEDMLQSDHIQQANYISFHLNKNTEQAKGFLAQKNVMHFLFKHGYPFDLIYLDSLTASQIAPYRVLILPFSYAVSEEAARVLEKAVATGKKVVLFDALGQVDQEGEQNDSARLQSLPGTDGVIQLGANDNVRACLADGSARLSEAMDTSLGENWSFRLFNRPGELEATLLEKGERDKTVFIINWENQPLTAEIGVQLPEGDYRIEQRDLTQTAEFSVDGKQRFSANDLRSLSIPLGPEEVRILHITAVAGN